MPPRKVTERKEIADSGPPKVRAQEAQHVHSSTMTRREEREKDINDSERRVRQTGGSILQSQQQDMNTPFWTRRSTYELQLQERELPERQKLRLLASCTLRTLQKRSCRAGVKRSFVHLSKDDRAPSQERTPEGDKVKDSKATAKQTKPPRKRDTTSAKGQKEPTIKFAGHCTNCSPIKEQANASTAKPSIKSKDQLYMFGSGVSLHMEKVLSHRRKDKPRTDQKTTWRSKTRMTSSVPQQRPGFTSGTSGTLSREVG